MANNFIIYSGKELVGKMATNILRDKLVAAGMVEVELADKADLKFVFTEDLKVRRNQKGYIYFGFNSNRKLVVLQNKASKLGPLFNLNFKKKEKVDKGLFSSYKDKDIGIKILNLLFGKSKETLPEILPFSCINDFVAIERLKDVLKEGKWPEGIKQFKSLVAKYELTSEEVVKLQQEVRNIHSYEGRLLYILKQFKGYYKTYVYPNVSDSIITNLVQMCHNEQIALSSKDENTRTKYLGLAKEEFTKAASTIRDSLFSKSGWTSYSKDRMKMRGVYTMFYPDDTLKTGEVLIPKPTKRFSGKEEYYPAIGDEVVTFRQPTNTVFLKCKVVGYTNDGTVRANFETILAFYGDADGDSILATWSKWSDSLNCGTAQDVIEFNKSAGIEIKYDKYDNNFDLSHFENLKPESAEVQYDKLVETGLEQAEAKLATKKFTGLLGNIDMEVSMNLIRTGYQIDQHTNWLIAELDQIGVQMKNIQKELANGELADKYKETFKLVGICSKNASEAASLLSNLTKRPQQEMLALLKSLSDIDSNIEIVEEHCLGSNNEDFFDELYQSL